MSKNSESKKKPPNSIIEVLFFLRLKALIGLVTGKKRRIHFTKDPQKLSQDLEKLHTLLSLLCRKNKSKEPEYLEKLSSAWKSITDNCSSLLQAHAEDFSIELKMKELLLSVNNFPKEADYKMGYYLSEGAGYEWLPVPFMHMLKDLHLEYQSHFESSQLSIWIEHIEALQDEIIY